MLISVIFFLINYRLQIIDFCFVDFLILSFFTAILGIFGDLIESFLKRCSDLKDSGQLLQDHGGVLDRVDSTLFNATFYSWIAQEFMHIKSKSSYDPARSFFL
mmetsp:Transcript_14177/g.24093  ORF Transcript_14177/g.24093 Transcript_14177/m.24093 type:complete len:103 (+) Transcript_14177:1004-1312(+)